MQYTEWWHQYTEELHGYSVGNREIVYFTCNCKLWECDNVLGDYDNGIMIMAMLHLSLELPKPTTYAHNQWQRTFSSPIDSSINKLTNYITIIPLPKVDWSVFFWGLLMRSVRWPRVFGCSLNAIGFLVQAATLLKITTWLIHNVARP